MTCSLTSPLPSPRSPRPALWPTAWRQAVALRAALVIFVVLATGTARAQAVTVRLASETVTTDETADVAVEAEGVAGRGVLAFSFTLTADPAVAELVGAVDAGALPDGWTVVANAPSPGELRVSAAGPSPLTSDGVLVAVRVRGVAPGASPLSWASFVANEGDPSASAVDGAITVTGATPGEGAPERPPLRVWPNPSAGRVWVDVPCAAGAEFVVVDALGRVVRQRAACGVVAIDGLGPGWYGVRAGDHVRPVTVAR